MKKPLLIACLSLLITSQAWGHAGHKHGDSKLSQGAGSGPVELTDEAIQNLDIETVEADIKPVTETVSVIARIVLLPELQAQITPTFTGRITKISATLGSKIKKGQPLATLTPISIGNQPVTLRSPMDGYLLKSNIVLGQTVNIGDVLMVVADYSQVLAQGITYESPMLAQIKVGQHATFVADIFPGHPVSGDVQRIDIALEDDSRTFDVYVLLDNKDLRLLPNIQGDVHIATGEAQELLVVPERAVLGEAGNFFVFVKEGNVFERRNVVLGIKQGGHYEILQGVFPGEAVVTRGNYQLQYAPPKKKEEPKKDGGE